MTDGKKTARLLMAIILFLPFIAHLIDGAFETVVLIYLASIAFCVERIDERHKAEHNNE